MSKYVVYASIHAPVRVRLKGFGRGFSSVVASIHAPVRVRLHPLCRMSNKKNLFHEYRIPFTINVSKFGITRGNHVLTCP